MVNSWRDHRVKTLAVIALLCLGGFGIADDIMKQELTISMGDNTLEFKIDGLQPRSDLFSGGSNYLGPEIGSVDIIDTRAESRISFKNVVGTNTIGNILNIQQYVDEPRSDWADFYLNDGRVSFYAAIKEGKRIQAWLEAAGFKMRPLPDPPLECGTLEYLDLLHVDTVPMDKVTALMKPIFNLNTRSLCSSAGSLALSQGERGKISYAISIAPNQWLTDNPPPVERMTYRMMFSIGIYPTLPDEDPK
jgi:hypothetical protein